MFLSNLALMDSNNFKEHAGVGEREGRIACNLVAKRHFLMTHGIGRSENVAEVQPNATGSSLMIKLVNAMLLESIRFMGKKKVKPLFILVTNLVEHSFMTDTNNSGFVFLLLNFHTINISDVKNVEFLWLNPN